MPSAGSRMTVSYSGTHCRHARHAHGRLAHPNWPGIWALARQWSSRTASRSIALTSATRPWSTRWRSDEVGSSCPTGGSGAALYEPRPGAGARACAECHRRPHHHDAGCRRSPTRSRPVTSAQTPPVGARLSMALAGVLDDASYNRDAAATGGSVSYAAPQLSWTGDLASARTVAITYSVTVSHPAIGNHSLTTGHQLDGSGQQLPVRQTERGLLVGSDRAHPGLGRVDHRRCGHRDPGRPGDLHDHGHQHGPDPIHRSHGEYGADWHPR